MTIYEGAELFRAYLEVSNQLVFGYVSILSGFLIMSYLAAHKLNNWLMALVLVLFTTVCAIIILQLNFTRDDMGRLYAYLLTLDGADTAWFGKNPAWAPGVLTSLLNFVTFGGYAGCVAYFFYQRNRGDSDRAQL